MFRILAADADPDRRRLSGRRRSLSLDLGSLGGRPILDSRMTGETDRSRAPSLSADRATAATIRVLMLGKGWFPSQLGGLNRYYRQLLEQLPEASGIVVGPADGASARVTAVSEHSASLATRLFEFTSAAWRGGRTADLVDAHFALYALPPLLIGALRHKPLVVHFQGPWAEENVSAGDSSRWRHGARRCLERAVLARAQLVVTLTGAFRRVLVERYGVSPWDTTVLAPGVDLERFSIGDRVAARSRLGLAPDAFVVCCARRLVPRMGLDVLTEAWAKGLASNPRARLLIAGDGDLREELAAQIHEGALDDSVTLLGRVTDEELVALYRAADVNVVPSVSLEGFGLVVLEAAACGTPTIVSRAGGLPEAISGLGEDLIVPAGDPDALGHRLNQAVQKKLPSREHTRYWAEDHGWEQVAEAHRELFRRVTSGTGGSRKLRAVYLDHVAQLSGGELALLRLLPVLPDVEAHVILAEEGPLVDRLLQAGISVEVLPLNARTRHLRKGSVRSGRVPLRAISDTFTYTLRLSWRLRRMRPDIVHTNSLKSGIYGSIAARLAGRPVVWHLRDRLDTDYLPRLGVHLVRVVTRCVPQVVISNSEATRRTLSRRKRSLVIPSVVDLAPCGSEPRSPSAPLIVGMVGRLAPWKGQDVFLRAFARAFPQGSQRAVIVGAPLFGKTEVAYAQRLRQLAGDLGIADRVEFRGHREDIIGEMGSMHILVHASISPEPFGQVVIEGMSAQLPVVASRGGGPEEIITDGVDGLLYAPGDVGALAEILSRLSSEPGLRHRIGSAAARRTQAFSPAVIGHMIMDAYDMARR
jgi:glycosyltransferase involved in cell wall biosynthesis